MCSSVIYVYCLFVLYVQGLCMVRKDLESTLKDKVPEDFIQLQSISNQQGEMLDSRLSAVWEQQEQTRELLEGGLAAFMASKGTTGTWQSIYALVVMDRAHLDEIAIVVFI